MAHVVIGRPTAKWLAAAFLAVLILFCLQGGAAAATAVTIDHGPTDKPLIALTFDDNYQGPRSSATLRILKEYHVPATMFVIGHYLDTGTALARELAASGLEIGDHTRSHSDCPTLSKTALRIEIGNGTDTFRSMTGGKTVPLFRPPYGHTDKKTAEVAAEKGFAFVVLWDLDTRDWEGASAAAITNAVLKHAHNGAIVLMHMDAKHTHEALPDVIEGLRAKGYQLVTLTTLLKGGRRFADVYDSTDTGRAVLRLVDAGLMSGYDDDYFGTVASITRAQLAKVAVNVAGLHTATIDRADAPTFADVKPRKGADGQIEAYPFDFVEEAAAAGFIKGAADAQGAIRFDPQGKVTRLQLAQIVARMARSRKGYTAAPAETGATFADVPAYARADATLVASLGLMKGYSSTRFDCWTQAERGHVAVVMGRFQDLLAHAAAGKRAAAAVIAAFTKPTGPSMGAWRTVADGVPGAAGPRRK